ncbi:MAG: 30S ribosomal protein S20 [Proteobacteria bacterium]|nr:30S ribosomal protein S20 [Pseudomonadota bacterium]
MANHKSAEKAYRQSEIKRARNASALSRVKSYIKKVEVLIANGEAQQARVEFQKQAQAEIHKAVSKGVLKKNTAARRIQMLAKKLKAAVGV